MTYRRRVAECIHGLEGTSCDVCFPKPAPVVAPKPRTRTAPAPRLTTPRAGASRSAVARPSATRAGERSGPPYVVGTQRLHRFVHVRELEAILTVGAIGPESIEVELLSPAALERRATREFDGRAASEHVAFTLVPESEPWEEVRSGGARARRWSDAARAARPADFAMLVTTIDAVGWPLVVCDDPADPTARVTSDRPSAEELLRRASRDEERRRVAEVLVPREVPVSALQLIAVAHEPIRDRIRALLPKGGPRVAAHPPWFTPNPEWTGA
ncbi:uncharacterized protein DUF4433 [Diaminobutyricimonas aerilata]|uniref:Uncharacterized protein DUF4433 n=1 Tax=Diaminobutyricimonas aerilata TaxID=1162967 RepID=A0A2M9CHG0_9MICO|nr:uncharacterized protein DUF4433 [Diaminobutyricimonas aerilata]